MYSPTNDCGDNGWNKETDDTTPVGGNKENYLHPDGAHYLPIYLFAIKGLQGWSIHGLGDQEAEEEVGPDDDDVDDDIQ